MMASFDAIVFSESCERRTNTTTPLQALSMMNGDLVREEAVFVAKRAGTEGTTREEKIRRVFQIALQRDPKPEELKMFGEYNGSLESICKVLLESNEFIYVH